MANPLSTRVKQVLVDVLEVDLPVTDIDDRLPLYSAAIGLDSLTLLRLIVALEEAFGCEIDDEAVMSADLVNVGSLVDLVASQLESAGPESAPVPL